MITRFAPSPSGLLHLGHAYAAYVADCWARCDGQKMILRHEDIDVALCHSQHRQAIEQDLDWLGIDYQRPSLRQTANADKHQQALQTLISAGYVYPCFCSRGDIRRAARAPHIPEGVYPRTCRLLSDADIAGKSQNQAFAYRLDMNKALSTLSDIGFIDNRFGECSPDPNLFGDVVLARKDGIISYHLAVVVDDADQGVTLVTRGEDLRDITIVHIVLQRLLGLPTPRYLHHHLVTDDQGVRLAKRTDAQSVQHYRQCGYSPSQLMALLPMQTADLPQ